MPSRAIGVGFGRCGALTIFTSLTEEGLALLGQKIPLPDSQPARVAINTAACVLETTEMELLCTTLHGTETRRQLGPEKQTTQAWRII